jgi:hypothetical protein
MHSKKFPQQPQFSNPTVTISRPTGADNRDAARTDPLAFTAFPRQILAPILVQTIPSGASSERLDAEPMSSWISAAAEPRRLACLGERITTLDLTFDGHTAE